MAIFKGTTIVNMHCGGTCDTIWEKHIRISETIGKTTIADFVVDKAPFQRDKMRIKRAEDTSNFLFFLVGN
mgnify:CR=1 FL=1